MVRFRLVLCFDREKVDKDKASVLSEDEFDAIAETMISRELEWPVLPREGESIFADSFIFVDSVTHSITKHTIEVTCYVPLSDGVAVYVTDKEGWNLDELSPAGKAVFLRKVREFEERRAQH